MHSVNCVVLVNNVEIKSLTAKKVQKRGQMKSGSCPHALTMVSNQSAAVVAFLIHCLNVFQHLCNFHVTAKTCSK